MTKVKPDCFEPEKGVAYPLCFGNDNKNCRNCQLWINYPDSPEDTPKVNGFKNPFTPDMIKQAVIEVHKNEELNKSMGRNSIIVEALDRQYPMKAWCEHNEGEKAARITCPVCEVNIIANYDLYKEFRKEWYCRRCGQRLILQA